MIRSVVVQSYTPGAGFRAAHTKFVRKDSTPDRAIVAICESSAPGLTDWSCGSITTPKKPNGTCRRAEAADDPAAKMATTVARMIVMRLMRITPRGRASLRAARSHQRMQCAQGRGAIVLATRSARAAVGKPRCRAACAKSY